MHFTYINVLSVSGGRGADRRWSLRRGRVLLTLVGCLALAMLISLPLPFGNAVHGKYSTTNPGQVRIFENGVCVATGTLVNRNWILTTTHTFVAPINQYTFRFGGVNSRDDERAQANVRTFDREPVVHPTVPDLALVHFADPVPQGTLIPRIATADPFSQNSEPGILFGWGDEDERLVGTSLRYRRTYVIDRDPAANREVLKREFPDDAASWGDARTFALAALVSEPGDSGGGFFSGRRLAGMHWGSAPYQRVNASGQMFGPDFNVSYEIPLWPYAAWIQSVVNGEGTSREPPHDELKRRRLREREAKTDRPVMTGPAEVTSDGCDPGDMNCYTDPVTPLAVLVASSASQGTALVGCAGNDQGDTCSFGGKTYPAQTRPRLPLTSPPQTGTDAKTGRRDIVIWCKYKGSLVTGGPAGDLVRFSFTNLDAAGVTPAYGWWDAALGQVEDPPVVVDRIDLDKLARCAV